jgi:hypothetical protein
MASSTSRPDAARTRRSPKNAIFSRKEPVTVEPVTVEHPLRQQRGLCACCLQQSPAPGRPGTRVWPRRRSGRRFRRWQQAPSEHGRGRLANRTIPHRHERRD